MLPLCQLFNVKVFGHNFSVWIEDVYPSPYIQSTSTLFKRERERVRERESERERRRERGRLYTLYTGIVVKHSHNSQDAYLDSLHSKLPYTGCPMYCVQFFIFSRYTKIEYNLWDTIKPSRGPYKGTPVTQKPNDFAATLASGTPI